MGGVFDWLRLRLPGRPMFEAFGPRPGLPALPPAPPGLPAIPEAQAPGVIAVPSAPPPALPGILRIFEAFRPLAVPPPRPAPPGIFEFVKPSPPAMPPPTPEEAVALWKELFPQEEQPIEAMFAQAWLAEPVKPPWQGVPPERIPETMEWMREFPDIAERTGGRMPLWILLNLRWEPPNTWQLAEGMKKGWDLLGIFDIVLSNTATDLWQGWVRTAVTEPATLEIEPVTSAPPGPYSDIGTFLGVPDHVIFAYARQLEGDKLLWEEVLSPVIQRTLRALDTLKPPGLRGWFDIVPIEGRFWLVYREAPFRPR